MLKQERSTKHSRILPIWAISYVVVFMVPLLVCILTFNQAQSAIVLESDAANRNYLSQVKTSIDRSLSSITEYAMRTMRSTEVTNVISKPITADGVCRYNVYLASKYLNKSVFNMNVDDVYIFMNDGSVLSGMYFYDKSYSAVIMRRSDFPYDEYLSARAAAQNNSFIIMGRESPTLYYVCRASYFTTDNVSADMLVIRMSLSQLSHLLSQSGAGGRQAGVAVLTDSGALFSNMAWESPFYDAMGLSLENGDEQFTYDGTKYACYTESSDCAPISYVAVSPEAVALASAKNTERFMALCLLAAVAAGIGLIFMLLKMNYRPVKSVLSEIGDSGQVALPYSQNEFAIIKSALRHTREQNQSYRQALEKHRQLVQQSVLMALLRGRLYDTSNRSTEEYCASAGISLKSDYFAVLLISFQSPNSHDLKTYSLRYFAVSDMLREHLLDKYAYYITDAGGMLAVLVNLDNGGDPGELFRPDIDQISSKAENEYHFSFYCAVSGIYFGAQSIPLAYREASSTMDVLLLYEQDTIGFYQELVRQDGNTPYAYDSAAEQQLMHYVRLGIGDEAHRLLGSIFERGTGDTGAAPELILCLIYDIAATLIKAADAGQDAHSRDIMRAINAESSVNGKLSALYAQTELICGDFANRIQERADHVIEQARQYIDQNFADENLNVTIIADKFGLTSAYFSRMFTQQTGERLLDYISLRRVERAKELLKGEENLQSIAEQTGLRTSANLIRIFKKYEGLTPGTFRDLT